MNEDILLSKWFGQREGACQGHWFAFVRLAGVESPCLDSAEHVASPSKVAFFLDHQARVEREILAEEAGGGILDSTQEEADAELQVAIWWC
jgi:hypothetical protein